MAVNLGAQPAQQLGELSRSNLLVQIGDIRQDLLPKLGRDQVAQGIGGEIADDAARPVYVLQNTLSVVGG